MFDGVHISQTLDVDAIVFGLFEDKMLTDGSAFPEDIASLFRQAAVRQAADRKECTGEAGNLVETFVDYGGDPLRVYLLGLGDRDKCTLATVRKAAAKLGRRLAKTKEETVLIEIAAALQETYHDLATRGRCFGESLGLLGWNGRLYRGKGSKEKALVPLRIRSSNENFHSGLASGLKLAEL